MNWLVVVCISSLLVGCGNTLPAGNKVLQKTATPTPNTTALAESVTVIQQSLRIPVMSPNYPYPSIADYITFPEVEMKGLPSFYKEPSVFQQGVVAGSSVAITIQTGQALLVRYTDTIPVEQAELSGTPTTTQFTVWNFEVCNERGTFHVPPPEEYVLVKVKDVGNMIAYWIASDNRSGVDTFVPQPSSTPSYGGTLADLQPFYPYPTGMTVSGDSSKAISGACVTAG